MATTKVNTYRLEQVAVAIVQQRLNWKPARLTVAVEYHLDKLRHVMYVRADSWVFTVQLSNAAAEGRDNAVSIESYAAMAAQHLNGLYREKGPPSVAPAPKRTKDEGPYPPWT